MLVSHQIKKNHRKTRFILDRWIINTNTILTSNWVKILSPKSDIKKDCKSTNHQPVITKASNSGSLLGEGGLSSAPVATFAPMPSSPLEPDSSNSIQRQAKPSVEIKSSDNQTASQSTAMFSHLAVQKSPQGNSGNDTFLASFPQGLENHSNYATSTFGQHFSPFSQVNSPDSIGNAASPSSWAHSASPTSSSGEIAPVRTQLFLFLPVWRLRAHKWLISCVDFDVKDWSAI